MKSPRIYGLVAGIVGAIAVALAYAASAPPYPPPPPPKQPRVPLSDEPIDLWMKLVPVFSHPRCVNCHGGVDPFYAYTGPPAIEHGGDVVGDPNLSPAARVEDCRICHNETQEIEDAWVLAHFVDPGTDFFGKTALQICEKQSHEVTHRRNAVRNWITHLRVDALIRQSFGGRAGGQLDPPDPPPMEHPAFMEAAQKWLDVGAVCGRWEGDVRQVETFAANYAFPVAGLDGSNEVRESAKRDITFIRHDGYTGFTVAMSGNSTIVQTLHHVAPGGPCKSVATAILDWENLPTTDTDASVSILIRDDGSYEIRVRGPEEKTRTTSASDFETDCPLHLPPPVSEPPIELTWDPWVYTIRCPSPGVTCTRFDPRNPVLKGSFVQTIVGLTDTQERKSWLNVSPVGTSRGDDGSPLPIEVKTEWDFTVVR